MSLKIIQELEAAAARLLHEGATEAEKIGAALIHEVKALFAAVASDPKVLNALRTGGEIAVSTAIGAAEAGGAGAAYGALKGALPGLLRAAEIPAESAAGSFVEATLLSKIETATAATPEHPNQ